MIQFFFQCAVSLPFFPAAHTSYVSSAETPSFTLIVSDSLNESGPVHPWETIISTFVRSFAHISAVFTTHAVTNTGASLRIDTSRANVWFLRANYAHRIDCVNVGSADAFTFYAMQPCSSSGSQSACLSRPDEMFARLRECFS